LFDLRASAVHQHQADAEAVEQGDVVNQVRKALVGDGFAVETDDKGLAAKGIDVRSRVAERLDEFKRAGFVIHGRSLEVSFVVGAVQRVESRCALNSSR
jgi:hypothetical protein